MKPISITLRQIDYVIATADAGSTAAAARMLNVSQPSVSLAIAKVEEHFGRPLFVRAAGQGVVQTSFGRQKLGEFRVLRNNACNVLSETDAGQPALNLGVFSTLGPRYAATLLRGFQDENPDTNIHLHEADLAALSDWLETGRIDVALIYDFDLPTGLAITPLANIRPYGLVPANHSLAKSCEASLAKLLEDPLILINLPQSRGYFLALAQMQGINPVIAHETSSVEMLRSMVANGLGVGLLATDIPHQNTYDGKLVIRVQLTGDLTPHRIALARSKRLRPTKTADQFCTFAARALSTPI